MPAGQQLAWRGKAGLPARMTSLRWRNFSRTQGFKIGLLRSATGKVGCAPLARNSSFPTRGCSGSSPTGPGPADGMIQVGAKATQPTVAFGANCGTSACGAAANAPAEQQNAQKNPAVSAREKLTPVIEDLRKEFEY